MTGSSWAPFVAPIVMPLVLAFWLFLVLHADSHPGYRHRDLAPPEQETGLEEASGQAPQASAPGQVDVPLPATSHPRRAA